jgi:hypothetical protein
LNEDVSAIKRSRVCANPRLTVYPLKVADAKRSLKEEALRESDADFLQRFILSDLFDAFRDDRRAQLVRKKTDALDQLTVATGDAINELPVDLDVVKWEALQQRDVAVLGAKVIDRKFYPLGLEFRDATVDCTQTGEQTAFGNF